MRNAAPPGPARPKPRWPRARRAGRAVRRWLARAARVIGTYWYSVAGLTCLTVAAFTVHPAAGWAAAGVAFLLLEWRVREPDPRPDQQAGLTPSRRRG